MSERKVPFAKGEFYHLYGRCIQDKQLFINHTDYQRFIASLYLFNSVEKFQMGNLIHQGKNKNLPIYEAMNNVDRGDTLVDIGAFCLMPNHFHLLVHEKIDRGISTFMQRLMTSYPMYFNKRYNRVGVLFDGRFKSKHVDSDEYLKYLFSYIHLNPVKIIDPEWKERGILDKEAALHYLSNYKYSSYNTFSEKSCFEGVVINKQAFPGYFSVPNSFDEYVIDWLSYHEEE